MINSSGTFQMTFSTATFPTRMSSDLLYAAKYGTAETFSGSRQYPRANFTMRAYQPVVQVVCLPYNRTTDMQKNVHYVSDDNELQAFATLAELYDRAENEPRLSPGEISDEYSRPIWMRSPHKGSSAIVGVFLSPPSRAEEPCKACTIFSSWRKLETTVSSGERGLLLESAFEHNQSPHTDRRIPIQFDLDDVKSVNTQSFTLDLIDLTSGWANRTRLRLQKRQHESILSNAFAAALSKIPQLPVNWDRFDHTQTDFPSTTAFEINMLVRGYGYGIRSTSVLLSVAIITTYCIIALIYVVYILATGTSSTAWTSSIELVALALQSQRSKHLRHTSTGIDSIQTFREEVGIRVNEQDELELVFANDSGTDTRTLRKLKQNKAY